MIVRLWAEVEVRALEVREQENAYWRQGLAHDSCQVVLIRGLDPRFLS